MYRTAESMAEEDGEERNLLWGADPSPLPPATHTWNGTLDASRGGSLCSGINRRIQSWQCWSGDWGGRSHWESGGVGFPKQWWWREPTVQFSYRGIDGTRGAAVPRHGVHRRMAPFWFWKHFFPLSGLTFQKNAEIREITYFVLFIWWIRFFPSF